MSDKNPWVHVSLPGHGTFWIMQDALDGKCDSPLAPEDHLTDGELNGEAWRSDSYAHVWQDGEIVRYGNLIGKRSDLVRMEAV